MADWRINEKYRKPRRTKGTPFYIQRNYYALGVIAFGGVCWGLFELWPPAKRFKYSQVHENKLKISEGLQTRIKHIQAGRSPPVIDLLAKARDREAAKYEDKSKPQSWLSKVLTSQPEI